jgi:filamentous hemagglutinin family protein
MNAARRPSRGIISLATLIYLGCVGSFAAPPAVDALPSGMTVLPGSTHGVSATVNGNTMTINAGAENSNLQTIRTQWQSFDIGAQATVNINNVKPPRVIGIERGWNPAEKSDVFLVSVSGNSPTQIFGRLNAPGYNLVLLNQNGVVFGPGARVDAGGIIASSLAIDKFERYDDALYIEVNGEPVPDPWDGISEFHASFLRTGFLGPIPGAGPERRRVKRKVCRPCRFECRTSRTGQRDA